MAKHNLTLWELKIKDRVEYRIQECMMHIANSKNEFKLIIPEEWLNDRLTKESIYKWLEIGNKTLFPAKINEIMIDKNILNSSTSECKLNNLYTGLLVEPRTLRDKEKYRSSDVIEMPLGTIRYLSNNIDSIRSNSTSRSFTFDCSCNRAIRSDGIVFGESSWGAYICDLQLSETKEPLVDHILRTYAELVNVSKEYIPAYEIIIDCAKTISSPHKLAILSFYRYLWSSRYLELVENTIKLESLGVDPWLALYYSLSKNKANYNNYYSLIDKPGFKSMDNVNRELRSSKLVNTAFSVSYYNIILFTNFDLKDEELVAETQKFLTKTTATDRITKNFICINPTQTLTMDKIYSDCIIGSDHRTINICGNDYKYRNYSIYRFNEVKQ